MKVTASKNAGLGLEAGADGEERDGREQTNKNKVQ